MTSPDRVYRLLPAILRLRDEELGAPLQQLLSVIEEQLESIEDDIRQLYDDMFIETCKGPLIDYFAELVAVHIAPLTTELIDSETDATAWLSRRHQVISAIATRAAKGTLGALERIAYETTGWPVRAVEQGLQLALTQSTRDPEPDRGRLVQIRDDASLLALSMPGAAACGLADARRGSTRLTEPIGPHPTTITVSVWRQEVEHIHRAPAVCVHDDNYYTFDALGYDEQLAVAPTPRQPGRPPAGDLDLPVEISRRQLRRNLVDYYGTDRSICVYRRDSPVPYEEIVVADLSTWEADPNYNQVAIDPETGRIAFPPSQVPEQGVWVRYHRLGVGPIGAGTVWASEPPAGCVRRFRAAAEVSSAEENSCDQKEAVATTGKAPVDKSTAQAGSAGPADAARPYQAASEGTAGRNMKKALTTKAPVEKPTARPERAAPADAVAHYKVAAEGSSGGKKEKVFTTVKAAVNEWTKSARTGGPTHGVIEIMDSSVYEEDFDIPIAGGTSLEIRSAEGQWPMLRSVDAQQNRPKRVRMEGYNVKGQRARAALLLSGLTITEHALELRGEFDVVVLDHCTIMPERRDSDRRHTAIAITAIPADVCISSSMIGSIRVNTAEVENDPITLEICDSIIDVGRLGGHAIGGLENRPGYAALRLERSTVLGEVNIFQTELAQDSIITGRFYSERRQTGEVRFCYFPLGSHVPRRIGCQPDVVLGRVQDDLQAGAIDPDRAEQLMRMEPARVRPRFDSINFGAPDYARLAGDAAHEITHGSEDDGELGAHHDLWLTRRAEDMKARLAEFTPIGADLHIVFAT